MASLLHVKSEFSLGCGTAPVEELVRRARDAGYSTLALTDVENLYAHVRFHLAAAAFGVKPITGIELRAGYAQRCGGARQGRLVLLARNRAGYEFLCRVVTRRVGPLTTRRLDATGHSLECLEERPEGVFFLSDDSRVIEQLREAGVSAGEIRFLAATREADPPEGIRAIAAPDVVMLDRADLPLHALLAAIREGRSMDTVRGIEPGDRSLPGAPELATRFSGKRAVLDETQAVAEACEFDLLAHRPALPSPALPPGDTSEAALERTCREELERRSAGEAYHRRLEPELRIIGELGLAGYCLIVGEVAAFAQSRAIPIAGRGSAGSSLVVWLLGLTQVDPIAHGLLFERFLHPGRKELPDIDIDIASNRREEVLDWIRERFGEANVASVCAHQTFGRKAAMADGLKALGRAGRFAGGRALLERLVSRPRHLSVHPGGVVIANDGLTRYVPLQRAPKGVRVTQYDMTSLALLGLVKLDLLGNRALAVAAEVRKEETGGRRREEEGGATLALLREGRTIGCFQIETPLMRGVLRRLPIQGVEEVMAALAIVRPGPASGETKTGYVRRARGEEPALAPHPRLASILRATYGTVLYEEDLVRCIAAMTGWSIERADAFRAELIFLGANRQELERLHQAFQQAAEADGVPRNEVDPVWHVLARFAAYSFNKAHAASYALIAWEAATLKAGSPVEFACGVLNHYGGDYPLRTVAADFARHGVPILGPDVNRSEEDHQVQGRAVRVGLSPIRYLTRKNRRIILRERPFAALADLLRRVPLSARETESLILSGACDDLPPLSRGGYPLLHERLLAGGAGADEMTGELPDHPIGETYRRLVRIRNEIRTFGLHPSGHPMEVLRPEANRTGALSTTAAVLRLGQTVRVAAIVAASHRVPGAGGTVQFVTLEDEEGLLEATIPPGVFAALGDPVDNPGPFLVEGTVIEDVNGTHLRVRNVRPFHERPAAWRGAEPVPG